MFYGKLISFKIRISTLLLLSEYAKMCCSLVETGALCVLSTFSSPSNGFYNTFEDIIC